MARKQASRAITSERARRRRRAIVNIRHLTHTVVSQVTTAGHYEQIVAIRATCLQALSVRSLIQYRHYVMQLTAPTDKLADYLLI